MTTAISKNSGDWLVMRGRLNTRIADFQKEMEGGLPVEEYHRARGAILLARELIEWVEPTTPPRTTEEDYGISDPSSENYA